MKVRRQGLIGVLLLALLAGWIITALIFPWLQRTFSEPTLSLMSDQILQRGLLC